MPNYYRKSLSDRITNIEKKLAKPSNPVLITDLNNDGTIGPWRFNEEQLDQYVKDNGYQVVFIDDISDFE